MTHTLLRKSTHNSHLTVKKNTFVFGPASKTSPPPQINTQFPTAQFVFSRRLTEISFINALIFTMFHSTYAILKVNFEFENCISQKNMVKLDALMKESCVSWTNVYFPLIMQD